MKFRHAYRTAATLGICVAALSGCKKSQPTSSTDTPAVRKIAFNASCPIEPEHGVSFKAPTVEYKGMIIGFCCGDCPEKWDQWPDSKKDEFIAAQKKALESEGAPDKMPETPDH